MSEPLKEFSINLPITPPGVVGSDVPSTMVAQSVVDATADIQIPPDVSPDHAHISVYLDSCAPCGDFSTGPCATFDMVLCVVVSDTQTGKVCSYKVVKRIAFDKVKLACDAECNSPITMVEAEEDQELVKSEMEAFHQTRRIQEIAGVQDTGKKAFAITFAHGAAPLQKMDVLELKNMKSRAHARYVFELQHKSKFEGAKITRIEEIK